MPAQNGRLYGVGGGVPRRTELASLASLTPPPHAFVLVLASLAFFFMCVEKQRNSEQPNHN